MDEQHIAHLLEQMHKSQAAFLEETDRVAMASSGRTYAAIQHLAELHERMIADSQAYMNA